MGVCGSSRLGIEEWSVSRAGRHILRDIPHGTHRIRTVCALGYNFLHSREHTLVFKVCMWMFFGHLVLT